MPVSYEFTAALNLIDVVFAKDQSVVKFWYELTLLYQNPLATETQNHKYIELLSEMASVLGFRKLQQTDIDKFYYPRSHAEALKAQIEWQTEWLRVLKKTDHFLAVPRASDAPESPFSNGAQRREHAHYESRSVSLDRCLYVRLVNVSACSGCPNRHARCTPDFVTTLLIAVATSYFTVRLALWRFPLGEMVGT